ncbi:MAG: hypothetical protein AAB541_02760, partial [Patescibacteria group bacterium]
LSNKKAQLRRPEFQKSPLEKHWAALCAARQNLSEKSKSFLLVGREGLEPSYPCGHGILSPARPAHMVAQVGVEPTRYC